MTAPRPQPPPSAPPAIGRHLLAVFGACVVFYVVGFWGLQRWRDRQGPWEVEFHPTTNGQPALTIHQPRLGIRDVTVVFAGQVYPSSATAGRVAFDRPERRVDPPFGTVRFLDTTFLPGTVTLEAFGHEIELLPRVLILDKVERAWESGRTHEVR